MMYDGMEIKTDMGTYEARAYDFVIADDLYLFFKFESPESKCEIGVAYDVMVDGGDWYVSDGDLGGQDGEIVDDIIWNRLPRSDEFRRFDAAVRRAMRRFNGME